MGDDLYRMVAEAFQNGKDDPKLLESLIVLTSMVEDPLHFKDLRPISSCNVAHKVNRFRAVLVDLVGPLQGSFIPDRVQRTILCQLKK